MPLGANADNVVAHGFTEDAVGKHWVGRGSKKRLEWTISFGEMRYVIALAYSRLSGKRAIYVNDSLQHEEKQNRGSNFTYTWSLDCHSMSIAPVWAVKEDVYRSFDLSVDGRPFETFLPHVEGAAPKELPKVEVEIVKASGLPGNGKTDAYCTCETIGKSASGKPTSTGYCKTSTVNQSAHPMWNLKFTLVDYEPGESLEFKVMDQAGSSVIRSATEIGKVVIPSQQFCPFGYDGLLDIAKPEAKYKTTLTVKITVTNTAEERRLRELFDRCDADKDGQLNKRELIKTLRQNEDIAEFFNMPQQIRQEDGSRDGFEKLFQEMDTNDDRQISWDEFKAFFARQPDKYTDTSAASPKSPNGAPDAPGGSPKDGAASPRMPPGFHPTPRGDSMDSQQSEKSQGAECTSPTDNIPKSPRFARDRDKSPRGGPILVPKGTVPSTDRGFVNLEVKPPVTQSRRKLTAEADEIHTRSTSPRFGGEKKLEKVPKTRSKTHDTHDAWGGAEDRSPKARSKTLDAWGSADSSAVPFSSAFNDLADFGGFGSSSSLNAGADSSWAPFPEAGDAMGHQASSSSTAADSSWAPFPSAADPAANAGGSWESRASWDSGENATPKAASPVQPAAVPITSPSFSSAAPAEWPAQASADAWPASSSFPESQESIPVAMPSKPEQQVSPTPPPIAVAMPSKPEQQVSPKAVSTPINPVVELNAQVVSAPVVTESASPSEVAAPSQAVDSKQASNLPMKSGEAMVSTSSNANVIDPWGVSYTHTSSMASTNSEANGKGPALPVLDPWGNKY